MLPEKVLIHDKAISIPASVHSMTAAMNAIDGT